MWQTQWEKPKKGGKCAWPSGPTRSKPKGKGGKGKSPNSSVPWPDHWASKNPKGVAYCRDHHLHNTTAGRMGGCVIPPPRSMRHRHALTFPSDRRPLRIHRPRGFPVSVGITGHQCESAHRGGEPSPPEPQRKADRAGEDFSSMPPAPEAPPTKKRSGPSQGTPEGRKHPFPRTHQGSGKTLQRDPEGEPPSKGRKEPPGQAWGQMTGGSDRSHGIPGKTEAQTGVDAKASAGVFKAVPHPAVRGEG